MLGLTQHDGILLGLLIGLLPLAVSLYLRQTIWAVGALGAGRGGRPVQQDGGD